MKRLGIVSAILIFAAGYLGLTAEPAHAKCTNVQFSKSNYHVNEIDGEVEITIKRDISLLGCPGTLSYRTQDDSAIAQFDYTALTEEYIFPDPREATHTFSIPIVNDVIYEGVERFKVIFESFNDATEESGTATVTITDSRQAPAAYSPAAPVSPPVVLAAKPTRPPSNPAAVSSPPPGPSQQKAAEPAPAIETASQSNPTAFPAVAVKQSKGRTAGGKWLLALLIVSLVAAVGVGFAVWRLRRSPSQHFSTL